MKNPKKTSGFSEGMYGQKLAEDYLAAKGYGIVARNYRANGGELDLVAMDAEKGHLVFIEVKYRRGVTYGTPAEAISAAKMKAVRKAADGYVYENGQTETQCRFDVIAIYDPPLGERVTEHIEDAF